MLKLTKKDVKRIVGFNSVYGPAYCSEYDYCKKFNISKYELDEIGCNSGVYGWNFTLYYDPKNNNYIVSSYRNAPVLKYKEL